MKKKIGKNIFFMKSSFHQKFKAKNFRQTNFKRKKYKKDVTDPCLTFSN